MRIPIELVFRWKPRTMGPEAGLEEVPDAIHDALCSVLDAVSRAGLVGLIGMLNRRTAVETAEPLAVDVERDDLIFFPLLYWPVTAQQPPPSPRAVERINRYLETGGTIVFDTRDAGQETPGAFGSAGVAVALAMGAASVIATGRNGQVLEDLVRRFGPRVRNVQIRGSVTSICA